jgi:hypothetical protein
MWKLEVICRLITRDSPTIDPPTSLAASSSGHPTALHCGINEALKFAYAYPPDERTKHGLPGNSVATADAGIMMAC